MARRRAEVPRTHWKITVSATTAARLENLLFDPVTRKPKYGARAKILERVLIEFLEKVERGVIDLDEWAA